MKPSSSLGLIAFTHGLAIAVGWSAYQASGFHPMENSTAQVPPGRTKSADRATVESKSGKEILGPILAAVKIRQKSIKEAKNSAANEIPKTPQEILDRIASIEIPTDFAKALEALEWKSANSVEISALAFHWMTKDSKAFFDWLRADPKRRDSGSEIIAKLTPEIYRRSGVNGVLAQAANAGEFKSQFIYDLSRCLGKNADIAGILSAKTQLAQDGANWTFLSENLGNNWAGDKFAQLAKLAVQLNEPMMLVYHKQGMVEDEEYNSYLTGLLADASLPEDFRQQLAENQNVRAAQAADRTLPLEIRMKNGGNLQEIINGDVTALLNQDRDWAFAFRNGQATAEEILNVVTQGTPDLAKAQPDALRSYLFGELAEENPAAAMSLLKDLPEDQRSASALFAARSHFQDVEPSKFLELLQQIPSDTPEQWDDRLDAWNYRSHTNNDRLQSGYVDWVEALPPGLDREMALYSLARAVEVGNPTLAGNLRSQVTDPQLKNRIARHR